MSNEKSSFTTGDLARHFGVSIAQLKYALETARVEPAERVGILRVYHAEQLAAVESAVNRTTRRPHPVPA